jgi:hypothetical protein
VDLPSFLLRHSVTVKTRTGSGAYGDVFANPVAVLGLMDDKRTLVRDINTGQQVVSSSTFYARVDQAAVFTPGSLVSYNGRETTVITVNVNDGGGLPTPDHVAVSLT